jgi:hypothetical protein
MPNPSPQRISVRTPPPVSEISSEVVFNYEGSLDTIDNPAEPSATQGSVLSIDQVSNDVELPQQRLIELDDIMEIETNMENTIGRTCRRISASSTNQLFKSIKHLNGLSMTTSTR